MDASASGVRPFACAGVPDNGLMSLSGSRVVRVLRTSIPDDGEPALTAQLARLPAAEQQRAQRFRRDADRARYVAGRLLLRQLAASVFGTVADEIRLGAEPAGRPIVVDPPFPLFVSLAHSGRHVVAALARRPVGIDVEELPRALQEPAVVERVCSPYELRELRKLPDDMRDRGFMSIWSRKEAYGKAVGVGIGFELQKVTVGVRGSRVRGVSGRWRIVDLELGDDCIAALVAGMRLFRVDVGVMESNSL